MSLYGVPAGNSTNWDSYITVYDGVLPIEERVFKPGDARHGDLLRRYYYEEGNRLALVEDFTVGSPAVYIPLLDDRGTVMGVADSGGVVIEKLYYNATGLCKSFDGSGIENLRAGTSYNLGRSKYIDFGYLGMIRDRFTGKYHTHFREYDPVHGRWLSEDPAGYADGLNLFHAYMDVNGADPLGLWDEEGMKAVYFEKYGQKGRRYWDYFQSLGGEVVKRDYRLDDWDFEDEQTLGLASSWWGGMDDSNETAAKQLYDALESEYGGILADTVSGMTNIVDPAVRMERAGFLEPGSNTASHARAAAASASMQDVIEDAAIDGLVGTTGLRAADKTYDTVKASKRAKAEIRLTKAANRAKRAKVAVGKGVNGEIRRFSSFKSLKNELGSAGKGKVWHHIVEQRDVNISQFGAESIHNTTNVVAVPRKVNQAIANYYSTKPYFAGGKTVRDWIGSKSWPEQYEFGQKILKKTLTGQPLP